MRSLILLCCVFLNFVSIKTLAFGVGDYAPDWILRKGDQQPISYYQDAEKRYSVLVFWETGCVYCVKLLPQLEKLRQKYTHSAVSFYALNTAGDEDPIGFMQEHSLNLTLLLNANDVARHYQVKHFPKLFLVNPSHRIEYISDLDTPNLQLSTFVDNWLQHEVQAATAIR